MAAVSPEKKYTMFVSALRLQMAHDTTVRSRESFSCQRAHFFISFPDPDNLSPFLLLSPLPFPHGVGAKPVSSALSDVASGPGPCQWFSPDCCACERLSTTAIECCTPDQITFQKLLSSAAACQCQIILCFLGSALCLSLADT